MAELECLSLLTAAELGERFGVTAATIGRWRREGRLEGIEITRRCIRYRATDLERLIGPLEVLVK